MAADFTKHSDFNKEANFGQVIFGADAPVLESELNEMQQIQNEARAELIRQSIPSGVLNWFEPTFLPTTKNAFKLEKEMKANVNGQIITIPKDTIIQMGEPPTADFQSVTGKIGYREDLVFLEVWCEEIDYTETVGKFGGEGTGTVPNHLKDGRIGEETSRRIQWKWRIRVAEDVDFVKFDDHGFREGNKFIQMEKYNYNVTVQGANSSPLKVEGSGLGNNNICRRCFSNNLTRIGEYWEHACKSRINDNGLFVGGQGDSLSKNELGTFDGYSYAIPLFRIKRRNSGGYGIENGNGATNQNMLSSGFSTGGVNVGVNVEFTLTYNNQQDYDIVNVGETYCHSTAPTSHQYTILSKLGNKQVKAYSCGPQGINTGSSIAWFTKWDRPDTLFANIIDKRDVIDLRHKVSLTGFNYQELLEENFDKLLRGELNTKEGKKMLKTYHGIRKTPIDSNTVFYASFDGTTVAEVGNNFIEANSPKTFKYSNTGLGGVVPITVNPTTHGLKLRLPKSTFEKDSFTIDCWIKVADPNIKGGSVLNLGYGDYFSRNIGRAIFNSLPTYGSVMHLRLCPSGFYVNGVYHRSNMPVDVVKDGDICILIGGDANNNHIDFGTFEICDLSISNIDRGDNFATLPKDFIDGYATISTAFNDQRTTYGDPLMSQFTQEVIKCTGETKKQYTITKAGANWASGDTIKVKGLTGEVITGVIDSDTAIANIVGYKSARNSTPYTVVVDKTTGLQVNDEVRYSPKTGELWIATYNLKVTNISGNEVTLVRTDSSSSNIDLQYAGDGGYLVETTTSSSSPVLKYMNGTTPTNVVGTWTGLGTNECTFTFGTNANLTNQDLEIQYSLNAPAGQGGISEVLTETLGGEYFGKKITKQSMLTITDDFSRKVVGSMSSCPHYFGQRGSGYSDETTTLQNPVSSNFYIVQITQDYINNKDNSSYMLRCSKANAIPQQLFEFDLIRIVEDKFGEIPSVNKYDWLVENVEVNIKHYGFGSCPSGNLLKLCLWNEDGNSWNEGGGVSHTSSSYNVLEMIIKDSGTYHKPKTFFCKDGKVKVLVYTDKSDGTTQSSINTDYINISLTLKTDSGFDILAPENTRRDDGKCGALLVRKETKEIRRYPLGNSKDYNGLVTYGDYVPYQGFNEHKTGATVMASSNSLYIISLGTGKPFSDFIDVSSDYTYKIPVSTLLPCISYNYDSLLGGINPYKLIGAYDTRGERQTDYVMKIPFSGGEGYRSGYNPPIVGNILSLENAYTNVCRGLGRYMPSFKLPYSIDETVPTLKAHSCLICHNNELFLVVGTSENALKSGRYNSNPSAYSIFKLIGAPLIKEVL